MRSLCEMVFVLLLAGCGNDVDSSPDPCETSHLDYAHFGKAFLLDWCTSCHSAGLPTSMRQSAPAGVDFDTLDGVRRFQERIAARASSAMPTMPPAGGPSTEERALLAEWIGCGAR